MSKTVFFYLACFALAPFSLSCSSVKKKALTFYLGGIKDKKAKKVYYLEPQAPYQKQEHAALDAFWWNPQAKSSISYFSNCSKVQKTLKQFQEEALPQSAVILKSSKINESLYSLLEIPHFEKKTYSGVYTLKRGDCYFNLNLVAPSYAAFQTEEPVFQTFIKNFKATR